MTDCQRRLSFSVGILRFVCRNSIFVVGLVIVCSYLVLSFVGGLIWAPDPYDQELAHAYEAPSLEHPLGRDELGRDILARIMLGARYTIGIGVATTLIGLLVGVPLGLTSAFYGGAIDSVICRLTDALLALPSILLSVSLISVLGPGLRNAVLAVGIYSIPKLARVARSSALAIKEELFVEAAISLGARDSRLVFRHILPNAMPAITVQTTYQAAQAILIIAGLSFVGLGLQPPIPEWGVMLLSGRDFLRQAPHITTVPGLAIFTLVIGFNFLGDGLRDVLDPRTQQTA